MDWYNTTQKVEKTVAIAILKLPANLAAADLNYGGVRITNPGISQPSRQL